LVPPGRAALQNHGRWGATLLAPRNTTSNSAVPQTSGIFRCGYQRSPIITACVSSRGRSM
jgi:hypothetical protein